MIATSAGLAATACGSTSTKVSPTDPAVAKLDRSRRRSGSTPFTAALEPRKVSVDLGGLVVDTWAFADTLGGPAFRMSQGDPVSIKLSNKLPESTTIHWHGLALRNDMDGVMDLTQQEVPAGGSFDYKFNAPHPGTFWFHPHMGLQLDRGLYAPFIIEDPNEPLDVDVDEVLMLDDWLDGIDGRTPDAAYADLGNMGGSGGMSGMDMGGGSMSGGSQSNDLLGGDAGDVKYDAHLINGKMPSDRPTFNVPAGGRIRLRLINAGSDTAYRVAIGGQKMTVTHADGFPVDHVVVESVLLGMGERYDVLVQPISGAWPIYAEALGKGGHASAVLRTSDAANASAPDDTVRPVELEGRLLTYRDLVADDSARLDVKPTRTVDVELGGSMMKNDWTINGRSFKDREPIEVTQGEHVRLRVKNSTTMWHPMHVHGHTFRLGSAASGPRKDTANVLPGKTLEFDIVADNPGQWMIHCHNTYHLELGMATVLSYVT